MEIKPEIRPDWVKIKESLKNKSVKEIFMLHLKLVEHGLE